MLGPSVLNSLSGGGNVYIQGVLTKNGEEGSTDRSRSRLRPFLNSMYNFRFNEPNRRLVDLKITILKAPAFFNWTG